MYLFIFTIFISWRIKNNYGSISCIKYNNKVINSFLTNKK